MRTLKNYLLKRILGKRTYYYMCRSLQRAPNMKHAHYVDINVRIDGQDRGVEADWLKPLQRLVSDVKPPPL
jgi:uncharacterized protein